MMNIIETGKQKKKVLNLKNIFPLILLAVSVLLMTCGEMEDGIEDAAQDRVAEPSAVTFGAYLNRSTTRAVLDLPALQSSGFGVFAFYTDDRLFEQTDLPNFMYNQQVNYDNETSKWTYSPIKYWPNEFGEGARSEGIDRLTFFAYAPYKEVDPATGRVTDGSTSGIVALTRPKDCGDPAVRYYATMKPGESVDLCWATPHRDLTKQRLDEKVTFEFHHALCALNVQIDADIDVVSHNTSTLDANTRIWVRSVNFSGYGVRGEMNLYSGHWNNLACDCDITSQPVTIYDGRTNGYEAITATSNEQPLGLNPILIQDTPYTVDGTTITTPATTRGVTNTKVNLFDVSDMTGTDDEKLNAPVYLIPTNEPVTVTITYDVETYDPKLASNYLSDGHTHGSSIQNTISATVTTDGTTPLIMEAGKRYVLGLHLGITSVKLNATVTGWEYGATANVDLPKD